MYTISVNENNDRLPFRLAIKDQMSTSYKTLDTVFAAIREDITRRAEKAHRQSQAILAGSGLEEQDAGASR